MENAFGPKLWGLFSDWLENLETSGCESSSSSPGPTNGPFNVCKCCKYVYVGDMYTRFQPILSQFNTDERHRERRVNRRGQTGVRASRLYQPSHFAPSVWKHWEQGNFRGGAVLILLLWRNGMFGWGGGFGASGH